MALNQVKAGVVLNYVVLGLNTLVGLLYTPYMLRMMGQSEYGLYSLVASVIAYLTIMDFGFGNAIVRYTAKFRAEGKLEEQYEMFGMFVVLYSTIGILVFGAGLFLYFNIDSLFGATMTVYELNRVRVLMILMLCNLSVSFPLGIFGSIITAYEDFIFQKSVQIIRIILNTVVMIVLLQHGYKALAMVIVLTLFNIMTLLLNLFYCKYHIKIRIHFAKFKWDFLREVAIYSFWIFLNAIMDRIYWSTGQFVLGAESGTIAVSVFAVAIQLETMYMSFSGAISSVFLPRVTSMVTTNRSDMDISDLFVRTGRIQYIIMAFLLSGFILFGRQFIHFWAGAAYDDVFFIVLLFFVALLIPLIQNMGISILQARNQMRFRSLLYICIAFVSLIMQVVLSKHFGAIGCAIAIAGSLILGQGLIMNVYYYKVQKLNMVLFWKEIAKMSLVPVALTVGGWFLLQYIPIHNIIRLVLMMLIFALLYVSLIWRLGMNSYERSLIKAPILRINQTLFR
jgi:O-antigen/teichoic acid export membrane protein